MMNQDPKQPETDETPPEIPVQIDGVHLLGERVLIRLYGPDKVSAGGIVLPERAQERKNFAWVTRMGPEVHEAIPRLEIGDTIVCAPHLAGGHPTFVITKVEYYEINARDIIAIIRKPE